MLDLRDEDLVLPTHALTPCGPIPTVCDPEGIYPYESYCATAPRPELHRYRLVVLENAAIRAAVCPDLGGRLFSLIHKDSGRETLAVSTTIRPVRILPRSFFFGGGIEVSFPIAHSPVSSVPVLHRCRRDRDRVAVACGERELRSGMHWTVEWSLGTDDRFLVQRNVFRNPTRTAHEWMSWSNAAVPSHPDTAFHFPPGPVLEHGGRLRTIDWLRDGPRRQADVARMTGWFWRQPPFNAFGAFTPSLGCGLYHVAERSVMPGIKLWSDGIGRDEPWVSQYTRDGGQLVEIQAGPLADQGVRGVLPPGGEVVTAECWIPAAAPLDPAGLSMPTLHLAPVAEVPAFGWARPEEVEPWEAVVGAHAAHDAARLPDPPDVTDNRWAPSGMEDLGEALVFARDACHGRTAAAWRFQLGAWLAGRSEDGPALDQLLAADDDRARVLAARLLRCRHGDPARAVALLRAIACPALASHPQVVCERDAALALLGPATLDERERALAEVAALDDDWLVERRATLLADRGAWTATRAVLAGHRFQRIHQRYARSRLWRRIAAACGDGAAQPPGLGEDDLAAFGAYRQHVDEDSQP
jgi:hypothetical protein